MKYWIWIFFLVCSCSKETRSTCFQGIEMTMPYRILVGHPLSEKEKELVFQTIEKTFYEVNTIYNRWNPDSEISNINREQGPFFLSKELETFFEMVDQMVDLTEGRFDPTITPILENQELISEDQVGYKKIIRKGNLLQKSHPQMIFDFCGIAKGYCIDLLVERLQELGYENLFVEWAGDMRSSGNHPEGRPWWVQIRLSQALETEYPVIYLQDSAIATSSENIPHLKDLELSYSHIIDPIHQKVHEITDKSIYAASVQAKSCAMADALATATLTFACESEATVWAKKVADTNSEIVIWMMKKDQSEF